MKNVGTRRCLVRNRENETGENGQQKTDKAAPCPYGKNDKTCEKKHNVSRETYFWTAKKY